jgi:hypothetical protein
MSLRNVSDERDIETSNSILERRSFEIEYQRYLRGEEELNNAIHYRHSNNHAGADFVPIAYPGHRHRNPRPGSTSR